MPSRLASIRYVIPSRPSSELRTLLIASSARRSGVGIGMVAAKLVPIDDQCVGAGIIVMLIMAALANPIGFAAPQSVLGLLF